MLLIGLPIKCLLSWVVSSESHNLFQIFILKITSKIHKQNQIFTSSDTWNTKQALAPCLDKFLHVFSCLNPLKLPLTTCVVCQMLHLQQNVICKKAQQRYHTRSSAYSMHTVQCETSGTITVTAHHTVSFYQLCTKIFENSCTIQLIIKYHLSYHPKGCGWLSLTHCVPGANHFLTITAL